MSDRKDDRYYKMDNYDSKGYSQSPNNRYKK